MISLSEPIVNGVLHESLVWQNGIVERRPRTRLHVLLVGCAGFLQALPPPEIQLDSPHFLRRPIAAQT